MSILPPQPIFSFSAGTGTAVHKNKPIQSCIACRKRKNKCDRLQPCTPCKNRGEADQCAQPRKDVVDRPTGYTHVSDTSILANRVRQLELLVSRLVLRVDKQEEYSDIIHNFQEPYPIFRPIKKDDQTQSEQEDNNVVTSSQQGAQGSSSQRERSGTLVASENSCMPPAASIVDPAPDPVMPSPFAQIPSNPFPDSIFLDEFDSSSHPHTIDVSQMHVSSRSGVSGNWEEGLAFNGQSSMVPGIMHSRTRNSPRLSDRTGIVGFPSLQTVSQPLKENDVPAEPYSKAPSENEHEALLALEGMALGRHYVPKSPERSIRDLDNIFLGAAASPDSPPTFSSFIHEKQHPANPPEVTMKKFPQVDRLPKHLIGKYLVDFYYDKVGYLWRCTHRPTWRTEQEDLLLRIRKSEDRTFSTDHLFSIALYAACLAVALHFLEQDCYHDLGIDEREGAQLAETCWQVSYQALEAADWMQVHSVKSCQTVIISGLYLASVRRANQHWTMLGTANKIAMSLGLTSIPDESGIETVLAGAKDSRWSSAVDREIGRRVWFCLVEHDWLFGMEHNFLYTLHEDLYTTSIPSNVDDVDISAELPVINKPTEVYTEMSYYLHRLNMIFPLRSLIMDVRKAGRIRYHFVLKTHEAIQATIDKKPDFLKLDGPIIFGFDAAKHAQLQRERQATEEGENLRLLRIHRYYFPSSCINMRYALTKQTCLECARRILAWRSQPIKAHRGLDRFWAQVYATLAATVIMVIYLQYAEDEELDEIKGLAQEGIKQIRVFSTSGHTDVGDTAETLGQLFAIQLQRRVFRPTAFLTDAQSESLLNSHKRTFEQFSADYNPTWQHAVDFSSESAGQMGGLPGPSSVLDDTELKTFLSTWLNTVSADVQDVDFSMWN